MTQNKIQLLLDHKVNFSGLESLLQEDVPGIATPSMKFEGSVQRIPGCGPNALTIKFSSNINQLSSFKPHRAGLRQVVLESFSSVYYSEEESGVGGGFFCVTPVLCAKSPGGHREGIPVGTYYYRPTLRAWFRYEPNKPRG